MSGFSTSYEVYVLQRGRWELHARHPSTGREAAIEEAKTLGRVPSVAAVKVTRDVYNEREGVSSEFTVYKSGNAPDEEPAEKKLSGRINLVDDDDDKYQRPRRPAPGPKTRTTPAKSSSSGTKSSNRLVIKLSVITIISIIIGGMITWVAAYAFAELPELRQWAGRDNYADILALVFALAFLITFAWSAYAFVSASDLKGKSAPVKPFESRVKKFERSEKKKWKQTLKTTNLRSEARPGLANVAERRAAEQSKPKNSASDATVAVAEKPEAQIKEKEPPETKGSDLATPKGPSLSVQGERQKKILMDFLRMGLEDVAKRRPKLDSFNKFGVNLFLAGACETAGLASNLSENEISQILNEGVQILGTKPEQAQRFADSYESYLIDPKYLTMIEAGRTAMQKQIAKQPTATTELSKALDSWNRPKSEETKSTGTIAVMFTDIVGSTQMTQTHGDAAAQDVVRTHNRIVRAALTMYDGREVKHTGDGIMASFNNTANGVEAGIYIQKQIATANAANPNLPLSVKIGINAGEPIVEDNDLFGTTVQLSARIVDKAAAGQVLVSDTVRGICQGKGFNFVNRGAREMKGFADPITLFEAVWNA